MAKYSSAFRLIILLLFTTVVTSCLFAEKLVIRGTSEYPNTLVRLMVYDDLISFHENTLAIAMTDNKGNFELAAANGTSRQLTLAMGLDRAQLFVKPGAEYHLHIPQQEQDPNQSFFEKESLHYEIIFSNDMGFSDGISEVNLVYNTFLLQYFNTVGRRFRTDLIDSLRMEIAGRTKHINDTFLNQYIDYKIATLEMASRSKSQASILTEYFTGKPVLYHNIEYMGLFADIFRHAFAGLRSVSLADQAAAFERGLLATDSLLSTDSRLASDIRLRELAMLLNLNELLSSRVFPGKTIENLLTAIADESRFEEHRKIAANILKQNLRLAFGTEAPVFRLNTSDGTIIDLRDFADKPILLSFVRNNCLVCENDLLDLQNIWALFQDRYHFLTIATAEAFDDMVLFFGDNGFTWPLVNLGQHILLLEAYNVRTFPEYIILLKNGRVGMAPAPGPERHLEHHLRRLHGE